MTVELINYFQLWKTEEWSAFKDKMIKLYKNKIEQNLFQKPQGFGDLAKKVGDILGRWKLIATDETLNYY